MTRAFVFTNHKGGVGKSTSATNIALGMVSLLRHSKAPNHRVLIVDTDSQGHATLVTTGRRDFGPQDSLYAALMAEREQASQTLLGCIVASQWDADLHVAPASLNRWASFSIRHRHATTSYTGNYDISWSHIYSHVDRRGPEEILCLSCRTIITEWL